MKRQADRPKLIVVCGLPGSGKTTHAKGLEGRFAAVRFCPDEWMGDLSLDLYDEAQRSKIESLQWKVGERLLTLGTSVIIEWGTWARSERDALRLAARKLYATVELHYLSASADVLFERVQRRGAENPPIGREAFMHWSSQFETPTKEEMQLFDEVYVIGPDAKRSALHRG